MKRAGNKYGRMTKAELIRSLKALEKGASAMNFVFEHERLLHELQVHQVELETQNHELRDAQHLVELSRDRYADLYDFAPVGYVTFDDKGVIREINLTAAGMLGMDRTRLVGVPFHLHVAREDLAPFRAHLRDPRSREEHVTTELRLTRKGGDALPVVMQSVLVVDPEEKTHLCRATLTDITERRRNEGLLRASEERYRSLVDQAVDGIFLADAAGRYLDANPAGLRMLGHTLEELRKLTIVDVLVPEEHSRMPGQRATPAAGEVVMSEWWFRRKDASVFAGELVGRHLPDGRFLGIVRDVTARKESEAALKERKEQLRLFIEHAPAAIAMFDREMRYLFVSRRWMKDYRLGERELRGLSHYAVFPEIGKEWREVHRRALAGEVVKSDEDRLERPDGSVHWLRWETRPWRDAKGEVGGIVIFSEDITARKVAEQALVESEARYRQLIHSLPVAVYTCDREGRITLFNAAAAKLWGGEPGRGQRWCASVRTFTPGGAALRKSELFIAKAVREGEPQRGLERIIERPDGGRSHVLGFPDPVRDRSGRIVGGVNVLVEITALKETEAALRTTTRQLQMLSHAVEQSPASVVITTATGEINYVNQKFTEVTGYTLPEVLGKNPRLLKSGLQPQEFYRQMWETIKAGREWRGEFCNRKKNGELFWEFAVIAPVIGSDGNLRHFVAIKEDITERRNALESLREREGRLRAILDTVEDAVITIDHRGLVQNVNPATERMFGYAEAELVGRNVKMLMPSPFRDGHDRYLENYQRTGEAKIIGIGREVQALRKDGTNFPVELAVSKMDHLGLFTGVIHDVTQRKRLERDLLETSEREQRKFGHELHDGLGQRLTALEMLSHGLAEDLKESNPALAKQALYLNRELRETVMQTRLLSHGLAPVPLSGDGLMLGLTELAAGTSQLTGVRCRMRCKSPVCVEDAIAATHLYRIAQEAVNNALKHGLAKRLEIVLRERAGMLELSVRNDGRPLPARPKSGGVGLNVMRYRAEAIGASLSVQSVGRKGVKVTCLLRKKT